MTDSVKSILINKAYGQCRVAKIENNKLYDLEIESAHHRQKIGDIWNAEVASIAPSLEAAFVNFGAEKNGFLPLREIAPEYITKNKESGKLTIKDTLFEGQKILVQVSKEERGSKGAALTTYITLAGCYLVLMPNNPKAGGISRRIEGEERGVLKQLLSQLKIPEGMGVIIRTAGIGKALEELQWDLDVLIGLWNSIKEARDTYTAPHLIHQESNLAIRAVRDHLRDDIHEILIDNKEIYDEIHAYVEKARPDYLDRINFYQEEIPLFSKYHIEKQIESAFSRTVRLPSGGEIVIDRAEALTAIDINSAGATKGTDIEETALNTNLEAAEEIARQLRIRDLGGLFVIDFIDMEIEANRRKIEDKMYEATRNDRARIQIAHISRFGLLEMSRQRLRPALNEASQIVCPRCHGQGAIRNIVAQSMFIVHLIEQSTQNDNVKQIRVQVPSDTAAFLLNEQRHVIENIEQHTNVSILIIPNPYLENPEYDIETVTGEVQIGSLSFELTSKPEVKYDLPQVTKKEIVKPAVTKKFPPKAAPSQKKGLFQKLMSGVTMIFEKKEEEQPKKTYRKNSNYRSRRKPYNKRRPQHDRYDSQKDKRSSSKNNTGQRTNYNRSRRTHDRNKENPIENITRNNEINPKFLKSEGGITQEKPSQPKTKSTNTTPKRKPQPPKKIEQQKPAQKPATPVEKPVMQPTEQKPVEKKTSTTTKQKPRVKKQPKPKPTVNTGNFVQIETTTKKAEPVTQQVKEDKKPKGRPRKKPVQAKKQKTSEEFEMVETKK